VEATDASAGDPLVVFTIRDEGSRVSLMQAVLPDRRHVEALV
jgi:hypothetical protein